MFPGKRPAIIASVITFTDHSFRFWFRTLTPMDRCHIAYLLVSDESSFLDKRLMFRSGLVPFSSSTTTHSRYSITRSITWTRPVGLVCTRMRGRNHLSSFPSARQRWQTLARSLHVTRLILIHIWSFFSQRSLPSGQGSHSELKLSFVYRKAFLEKAVFFLSMSKPNLTIQS